MPPRILPGLFPFLFAAAVATTPDTIQAVRTADAARQAALVAGDIGALREWIDPDCVYTHGSGRTQSGEDFLALLAGGELRYEAMRYEFPPLVRLVGPETALVSGRVRLTARSRDGAPNERIMAATAAYRHDGNRWRLVSYQSTPAPAAPTVSVVSHRVAVEDVCAWPKLTLLADGTVVAALYDQPSHGLLPGDVASWASRDGGETWERRGNATRHEGNSAWFNHALGQDRHGGLVVASSGWSYHADGGKTDVPLPTRVSGSSDGGRTWRELGRFPASPKAGEALIPFGNIELAADGSLRVAAFSYARNKPGRREDAGYMLVSRDEGATWSIHGQIDSVATNETDVLPVGPGRWLAAARNLEAPHGQRAHSIDLWRSEDDGITWRRQQRLTAPDCHPGDLLRLRDGRILLTYGDRRGPDFGVNGRLSADDGRTWTPEFRVLGGFRSRDSGYPSSVELADGTIVTAYYARGSDLHDGYHLGIARWRLE